MKRYHTDHKRSTSREFPDKERNRERGEKGVFTLSPQARLTLVTRSWDRSFIALLTPIITLQYTHLICNIKENEKQALFAHHTMFSM